jgi:hypothetical protein
MTALTGTEKSRLSRERAKLGLVQLIAWVPADKLQACKDAIAEVVATVDRRNAFDSRPLPDHWRVGDRIRYIRDKEHCCDAGALGVVVAVGPECAEKLAGEYQVFWTCPQGWTNTLGGGAKFWTTPDEVELVQSAIDQITKGDANDA